MQNANSGHLATCPCCGYRVISSNFEICGICGWEYDPAQNEHPDLRGPANRVTLREAQRNYLAFGAKDELHRASVSAPTPGDERDPQWKPLDPKRPARNDA
jgi:hypothetical protein